MAGLHEVQNGVLTAGADVAEVLVTFAYNGFPNQELGG